MIISFDELEQLRNMDDFAVDDGYHQICSLINRIILDAVNEKSEEVTFTLDCDLDNRYRIQDMLVQKGYSFSVSPLISATDKEIITLHL